MRIGTATLFGPVLAAVFIEGGGALTQHFFLLSDIGVLGLIVHGAMSVLERLFAPRSVAVLGASANPAKVGNRIVRFLAPYDARIYPIHPSAQEIEGRPTYPSLDALPEPVDLIVALVPGDEMVAALRASRRVRAAFLLAIPSGFGEIPGRADSQRELVALARQRGMRIVGPNVVGVFNVPLGFNPSLIPPLPAAESGVSFATQSGGFGMMLWLYAATYALDVAAFCDVGNTGDITLADVLTHFAQDARTRAVGLFAEAIDDGRWREALRALAARKPVVVASAGRSAAGRRASIAHIGREAGQPLPLADVPPGAYVVETARDLFNAVKALVRQPAPRGKRIAVLTGTGGFGVEMCDLCCDHGLTVPPFSAALQARFTLLPSYAARANPVDFTSAWYRFAEFYPQAIEAIRASGEVDAIVAAVTDVATQIPALAEALAGVAHDPAGRVPVYLYWASLAAQHERMRMLERAGIPCYETTLEAIRTVASLASRVPVSTAAT
ncbi:MAG: CoA-binding protein [Candidatus Eremiobacteraeota bacterium]|nr:CoA-binding protein [Candidatus Eremiobacteraeota bacterium]